MVRVGAPSVDMKMETEQHSETQYVSLIQENIEVILNYTHKLSSDIN
jgi:hypothetical protein